jgi:hypothetical protein
MLVLAGLRGEVSGSSEGDTTAMENRLDTGLKVIGPCCDKE